MRYGVGMVASIAAISISSEDKETLERWVRSGRTEQRVAFRAKIILKAAAGLSNHAIARELSTSRPTIIDWRNRYMEEGVKGLTSDRPRGKGFVALPKEREAAILEKTLKEKPEAATHWSCRSMAEASGVSFRIGYPHLERARPETASGEDIQIKQRSAFHRETA